MLEGFDHSKRWVVCALLLACHVYFLQIYPHFISPNELSRLLLTSAIADDHSLSIDNAIQRYGDPQDKAKFNGHYYSDKAIGTSLLGVPAFVLMRIAERITGVHFSTQAVIFWLRLFTVTIPSLFFLAILTRFWSRLKSQSSYIPHFVFVHVFGTIAFTYSNQFVSHYLLGITLFCSAFYMNEYRLHTEGPLKYILFSGVFAGLSLLLEFPAAVPVAVLCVFTFLLFRNFQKLLYFALPVLSCVVIILGYNYLIFGTPWDVTYRHMTHSFHTSKHAEGFIGMGLPKLEALHGLLFSRHHGLFFISPFLLLSIAGFYKMSRNETWSTIANLFIGVVLAVTLTYSAFSYWIAGWNFGPRYITPVVPFLSTAAFFYADEFLQKGFLHRTLFAAISVWSVLCVTIATITFPFPPDNLQDPIFFLNFPLLFHGATGKNLGGNPWFFFTLLVCTWVIMTFPAREIVSPHKLVKGLASVGFAALLFMVAFLTRPEPSAMEYYARGSVYLYLGHYRQANSEMENALDANPDSNSRALIQRRLSDLSRFLK